MLRWCRTQQSCRMQQVLKMHGVSWAVLGRYNGAAAGGGGDDGGGGGRRQIFKDQIGPQAVHFTRPSPTSKPPAAPYCLQTHPSEHRLQEPHLVSLLSATTSSVC